MAGRRLIELKRGALEVSIVPEVGGAMARFAFRGQDLLRRGGRTLVEEGDVQAAGCFPLVPFSGRVADGRFTFEGETVQLEPNFPPEPHAIHGQGWQHAWEVRHENDDWLELGMTFEQPGTPFNYEARETFRLEDQALEVELEVKNRGAGRMPAGLGLHPFFVRSSGVTLQTRLSHMWLADERNIPRERVVLPEHLDFSTPLPVAPLELDNGFDGFDGKAQIVWPELGRRVLIHADDLFDRLVIYVPAGKDFFCVEPASNANNGFNLMNKRETEEPGDDAELELAECDPGVRILEPGEALGGKVRFEVG